MTPLLKSILCVLFTALSALLFTACGGDSSAPTGPSSGGAFAGTSISFNPTINFQAGDALTYFNNEAGTPFPSADPAINGTYTYTPNASFTAGTLTLTLDGVASPLVLEISNFRRSGANVSGFTARSGGQSYPVDVTGTLVAYQTPASGGGSGNGGLVNATSDINPSTQGTYELTFFNAFGGSQVAGSPYEAGQTVPFVIGGRTLQVGAKTLSNPQSPRSSPSDHVYQDGTLWYWIYGDRTPVRIQVYGGANPTQAGTVFYGGFEDESGPEFSVDGDLKFVTNTSFPAYIVSADTVHVGLADNSTPEMTDPTYFNINEDGALRVSTNNGGAGSLYVLPFVSADATTVTYRLTETGTPDKTYTVVITKDGDNRPSALDATFVHSRNGGARSTTRTYEMSLDEPQG